MPEFEVGPMAEAQQQEAKGNFGQAAEQNQ